MNLIYHLPNGNKRDRSPFDVAINNVVKNKTIKIVCPYIGLNYFESVIIDGCKDWELLTDVNALINSQQNRNMAEKTLRFLDNFHKKIRHLDGLHAKVIISEGIALIGSANFTTNGITKNNEMSIITTDFDKIRELNIWYNTWLNYAIELGVEIRTKLNERVKEITHVKNDIDYGCSQKLINSYYESINITNRMDNQKDEEYLI